MPADINVDLKNINDEHYVTQQKKELDEIYNPNFEKEYSPDRIAGIMIDVINSKSSEYNEILRWINDDYKKKYAGMGSKFKRLFSSGKKKDYEEYKSLVSKAFDAIKTLYWYVATMKLNRTIKRIANMKNEDSDDSVLKDFDRKISEKRKKLESLNKDLAKLKDERKENDKKRFKGDRGNHVGWKAELSDAEYEDLLEKIKDQDTSIKKSEKDIAVLEAEIRNLTTERKKAVKSAEEKKKKTPSLYDTIRLAHSKLLKCLEDGVESLGRLNNEINYKSSVKSKSSGKMMGFGNDDAVVAKVQLERLRSDFNEYKEILKKRQEEILKVGEESAALVKKIEAESKKREQKGYSTTVFNDLFLNLDGLKQSIKMGKDEKLEYKIIELNRLIDGIKRIRETQNPQSYVKLLEDNKKYFEDYIAKSQKDHDRIIELCRDHIARINEGLGEKEKEKTSRRQEESTKSLINKKSAVVGVIKDSSVVESEKKGHLFKRKLSGYYIFDNNMGIPCNKVKKGQIPEKLIEKSKYKTYIKVKNAQQCLPIAERKEKLVEQYDHQKGDTSFGSKGPFYVVIDGNGNVIREANHPDFNNDLLKNWKVNYSQDGELAIQKVQDVLQNSLEEGKWLPDSYTSI